MTPEISSQHIDGLIQIAKWISALILTGVGLCATIVALRALNKTEIKFGQIELKLRYFPVLLLALSIAHLFVTWMFMQKVKVILIQGIATQKAAWLKLQNSEAFVFNNMQPRLWDSTAGPTRTWLVCSFCI